MSTYTHTHTLSRTQTQWMMYWIVFALFQAVEVFTDAFIAWLEMRRGEGEGDGGKREKERKG